MLWIETGTILDQYDLIQIIFYYIQLKCLWNLSTNLPTFRPHYHASIAWSQLQGLFQGSLGPQIPEHKLSVELQVDIHKDIAVFTVSCGGSYVADLAFLISSLWSWPLAIVLGFIFGCGINNHVIDMSPIIKSLKKSIDGMSDQYGQYIKPLIGMAMLTVMGANQARS